MESQPDHTSAEDALITQETPPEDVFIAPSIDEAQIISGHSYAYHSSIPPAIAVANANNDSGDDDDDASTECVLGIDEAGRGPVLGPMVYGLFYVPVTLQQSLLAHTHHFDDSKVLTPKTRSQLMRTLCAPASDLHAHCGWATKVMSARDIAAGMLRPKGMYNLNAQAMDATVELIRAVLGKGVNVKEIYIDTVGPPKTYQQRLAALFPTVSITVAKKADSLYPCVSAASVCAKVTRDAALEVSYRAVMSSSTSHAHDDEGWGSGYPSDARCASWLKRSMDPVFGWGNECRFSWSTAKDLLEEQKTTSTVKVEWPANNDDDDDNGKNHDGLDMTAYLTASRGVTVADDDERNRGNDNEMIGWYGVSVAQNAF